MAFQISPGVNFTEIDLTTIIPAVSTTEAALVAEFRWGPLNERVLIESEGELELRFWRPDDLPGGSLEMVCFAVSAKMDSR